MFKKIWWDYLFLSLTIIIWGIAVLLFFPAPIIFWAKGPGFTMGLYWALIILGAIFAYLTWVFYVHKITITDLAWGFFAFLLLAVLLFPQNIPLDDVIGSRECNPIPANNVVSCYVHPNFAGACGWRYYEVKPVGDPSFGISRLLDVSSDMKQCLD